MYVPAWPGLSPAHWFRSASGKALPFPLNAPHRTYAYVARNLIYHLFAALRLQKGETVLVPDYHHGNEIRAIRAAGVSLRFYPVRRNLEVDLDAVARLCRTASPRALFVIHYLGWPQPMKDLTALCRERGMWLIEDCALSLLSEPGGQPLGAVGDYAVFCLYKTLPLPNGGLLVQNRHRLESLAKLEMRPCDPVSVAGRNLELTLEWLRSRFDTVAKACFALKQAGGRALSALGVTRVPVGDSGFDLANAHLGMSSFCHDLLKRFDYDEIRQRRRENYARLCDRLRGKAALLKPELEWGVCPLFFPLLVSDKHAAMLALRQRGIEAVEFWNDGDPQARSDSSFEAQFLRDHLLELPIHQDLTPAQAEYVAEQVVSLKLRLSSRGRAS